MTLSETRVEVQAEGFRVAGRVRASELEAELFYEVGGGVEPPAPEMASAALVSAALASAAWMGEDLRCDDPVDAEFLRHTGRIARALKRLHGFRRLVHVEAPAATSPPRSERVVAASFSGGIDSLHTLRTQRASLGALVTAFGFDTQVDDHEAREQVGTRVRRIADAEGLPLYLVRTNFRAVFGEFGPWGELIHGALLASLGFVLSGGVHTYLVPSSYPIDQLFAWGSHPLLDEAYVSSHTRIVHDAWEVHRNEKLAEIADWPLAMENLRVCLSGRAIDNCGRCEKCVRTMILLYLNDRLDSGPKFGRTLTPKLIRHVKLRNEHHVQWHLELAEIAQGRPEHRWIAKAIRGAVWRSRLRNAKRTVKRRFRRALGLGPKRTARG